MCCLHRIIFTNKSTSSEDFNEICKISLYGISDNMAYLVEIDNHSAINITDTKTVGYSVIYIYIIRGYNY